MTCSDPALSVDESNLCRKALKAMKEHFHLDHFYQIHLEKCIPMAAGLAGGSADAAAVIHCIEKLENLEVKDRELEELAVSGYSLLSPWRHNAVGGNRRDPDTSRGTSLE